MVIFCALFFICGDRVYFVSFTAIFSKLSCLILDSCTKFPINHCRAGNSKESVKNPQKDNLPVSS